MQKALESATDSILFLYDPVQLFLSTTFEISPFSYKPLCPNTKNVTQQDCIIDFVTKINPSEQSIPNNCSVPH